MVGILRALVFGLALWIAPAAQAQTPEGLLRVGTFPDNRPWEFREGAQLVGFEIDLINRLAEKIGRRVEFVEMSFGELLPAVADGRIDVAICTISITPERRRLFDFTQPYYQTSQGIAVLKNSRIRSIAGLAGKKVGTEAGSTNEDWLRQNRAKYGLGETVPITGFDSGLALLESGAIDGYFGDMPALLFRLLTRPDLAVVARLPTEDDYAIALRHSSPLTAPLDEALAELKRDGTLATIHQRWFGMRPEADSPVVRVLPRP